MSGARFAGRTVVAAAIAAALGACASPGAQKAPPDRQARGAGGYYRDDGPGDRAPADPMSVPDAVPRAEPMLERANRPYTVFDRQYVPMVRLEPFRQRGVGTWYGRRYHGQRTSSGEVYDMYAMTAAHPTLPIPSYARVTNVANGRSAIVRVNDRGPFLYDRIIDLSWTAAARLGYVAAGSAELDVELITRFDQAAASTPAQAAAAARAPVAQAPAAALVLVAANAAEAADRPLERLELQTSVDAAGDASSAARDAGPAAAPAPPVATPPGPSKKAPPPAADGVWLQLGAFASRENADALRARIARQLDWPVERIEVRGDGGAFKVQAGPFARRDDALAAAERIRAATGARPFVTTR